MAEIIHIPSRREWTQPLDYSPHDSFGDPDEGVYEYLDELRASARKWVRAFCIAAAVFAIVWFGGQFIRSWF